MRTACGSGSAPQLAGTAGPRDGPRRRRRARARRCRGTRRGGRRSRQPEIGDPVEPRGCAYRDLRCLRCGWIRRPTSVGSDDGTRPSSASPTTRARPFDAHAPELDSLRQDERRSRRSGALPDVRRSKGRPRRRPTRARRIRPSRAGHNTRLARRDRTRERATRVVGSPAPSRSTRASSSSCESSNRRTSAASSSACTTKTSTRPARVRPGCRAKRSREVGVRPSHACTASRAAVGSPAPSETSRGQVPGTSTTSQLRAYVAVAAIDSPAASEASQQRRPMVTNP